MREMFNKAFGITLGFYMACVVASTLGELAKRLTGKETDDK